jgi:uncharacterized phosphosugar-binding protein
MPPLATHMTSQFGSGFDRYCSAVQALQARVIDSQRDPLEQIAGAMTETILREGRIFVFGTGHSHLLAEEGHFRAGGLAPVVPILSSALMLHESAIVSGRLERLSGIAGPLLDRYHPQPGEMLFIFSNSGVNLLPVEMALIAKARGLTVVSICSMAYARVAPLSVLGKRLFEVADYAIDNGGEPGDSLITIDDLPWRVGPSSTVIGALIWNALITEVACQLQARSIDVPVYASGNMPGAHEHNAALVQKWHTLNPHI